MNKTPDVKDFFIKEDPDLLICPENLTELHRRVSVFHHAWKRFDELYEVLSSAYRNTAFASWITKTEYITNWAKWYIWEILFGDSNQIFSTYKETKNAIESINKILEVKSDSPFNELKISSQNKLLEMLSIAYLPHLLEEYQEKLPHLGLILNLLDTLHSEKREIRDSFELYKKEWLSLEEVLVDLQKVNSSFMLGTYYLFTNQIEEWYPNSTDSKNRWEWDKKISIPQYQKKVEELIAFTKEVIAIKEEQRLIFSKLSLIDTGFIEDTSFCEVNISIQDHIAKHNVCEKAITYTKVSWYQTPTIAYNKIHVIDQLNSWFHKKTYYLWDIEYTSTWLDDILDQYQILKCMKDFDQKVWRADYEKINNDKLIYGAKWAFLSELLSFQEKYTLSWLFDIEWHIPETEKVSIEHFVYWQKHGQLNKEFFAKLYERRKDCPNIIIRSSAVYSEDNEQTMGAGIYQSVKLKNVSFESFCNAVEEVYKSYDSEVACNYRAQNNIAEEYMGLVIEPYISGWDTWQINTIVPYRPELMEYSSQKTTSFRPIFLKSQLLKGLFWYEAMVATDFYNGKLLHYKLDFHKFSSQREDFTHYYNSALLSISIERYFWKPIQIEVIIDDTIHVVQSRLLPSKFNQPTNIQFPIELAPIWEWRAIWMCDIELDVLETWASNNWKVGAVSFTGNHEISTSMSFIYKSLPKSGAVIIRNNGWDRWHIETICVEKDVVCLFTPEHSRSFNISQRQHHYKDFNWFKKIRVVANGLEGKIYWIWESKPEPTLYELFQKLKALEKGLPDLWTDHE